MTPSFARKNSIKNNFIPDKVVRIKTENLSSKKEKIVDNKKQESQQKIRIDFK